MSNGARILWQAAALGAVGLLLAAAAPASCGGKAIVDGFAGEGGGAGTGTTTTHTGGTTTWTSTSNTTWTTVTGTPTTWTTTTWTTTTFEKCDVGNCDSCLSGDCMYTSCQQPFDDCYATDDCMMLGDCWNTCSNPGCMQDCNEQYPDGVAPLYAVYDCVFCQACATDCQGYWQCYYD